MIIGYYLVLKAYREFKAIASGRPANYLPLDESREADVEANPNQRREFNAFTGAGRQIG